MNKGKLFIGVKLRNGFIAFLSTLLFCMLAMFGISGITAKANSADGYGKGDLIEWSSTHFKEPSIKIVDNLPVITLYYYDGIYLNSSPYAAENSFFVCTNPSGQTEKSNEFLNGQDASSGKDLAMSDYFDFSATGVYEIKYYLNLVDFNNGNYKYLVKTFTYTVEDKTVPLPADPVKEGHTFVGWYFDSEFTRPYDGSPIYEDTALYAKFEINKYTVTYNVMGGVPVDSVVVDWNTAAPTTEATRTGYNFVGWFTSDDEQYNGEPIKADVTLYAKWEIKIFDVTFYTGDVEYKTIKVPYGTRLIDALETADLESYNVTDMDLLRVSKQSIITEDTQVLVHELTKDEKFGDYIGRNMWVVWTAVGVLAALAIVAGVSIFVAVKRK